MKKAKLEMVLMQLQVADQRKLKKFISSPYFNVNQPLIKLFNYYISILPENAKMLDNEQIWIQMGLKPPFNDVRFRKYQSDLTKLILRYLTVEDFLQDKHSSNLHSLRAVRKKNIKPLENVVIKNHMAIKDQNNPISVEDVLYDLNFEKEIYLLEYKNKRIKDSNLPKILDLLDQYYFSEKFKFATDLTIRSKLVSKLPSIFFMQDILDATTSQKIALLPLGEIYKLVYLTESSESEDDKYFLQLEKILDSEQLNLDSEEAISIYSSLINFCVKKINLGQRVFLSKLLNIYKKIIDSGNILENKIMDPANYKNIVITALREQEFEWAENFAIEYGQYLPQKVRENILRFQLGVIYFYKKEFNNVIEVFRDFEFEDLLDNLRTKATLIQTYYELNEFDALDSLLKSLRTYITRHKELDSGRRSNYKNLIKIMSQIIQIIPGDKKKIDKIKKTLSEMKGIAVNRTWIEEKIAFLEN